VGHEVYGAIARTRRSRFQAGNNGKKKGIIEKRVAGEDCGRREVRPDCPCVVEVAAGKTPFKSVAPRVEKPAAC